MKVMQVAALLPDQYYSSYDRRCVGSNLLDADFREVSPNLLLLAFANLGNRLGPQS